MKNSIEEDIECIQEFLEYSQDMINDMDYERPVDVTIYQQQINSMQHILSDYKRVLKENEELTISNKEIDKECNRLEEKEVKLINENEHYKNLIHALETYYDITEEDLKECMKNDRWEARNKWNYMKE